MNDRIPVRFMGMSSADLAVYTGPTREVIVNLDNGRLHVQDNKTPGGLPSRLLSDQFAGELRFDIAQALSPLQRAQGRLNLGTGRFESEAYFNLLLNPRQRVQQFNNSGALNNGSSYLVDGWVAGFANLSGSAGLQTRSGAGLPFAGRNDLDFGLYLTCGTAKAALGNVDQAGLGARIEGIRCQALQWGTALAKPALVAFMIRASYTGKISIALRNATATRSFVHEVAVTAGVEQFVSFVVPGDTSGVWKTDTGVGLYFDIGGAVGGQLVTNQPDAWQAGNFVGTTTMSNMMAVANQTIVVGDLLLLPIGDVSITPAAAISADRMQLFRRQDEDELLLCLRHYESGQFSYGFYGLPNVSAYAPRSFSVRKRAAPNVALTFQNGAQMSMSVAGVQADSFYASIVNTGNSATMVAGTYTFVADARL